MSHLRYVPCGGCMNSPCQEPLTSFIPTQGLGHIPGGWRTYLFQISCCPSASLIFTTAFNATPPHLSSDQHELRSSPTVMRNPLSMPCPCSRRSPVFGPGYGAVRPSPGAEAKKFRVALWGSRSSVRLSVCLYVRSPRRHDKLSQRARLGLVLMSLFKTPSLLT